MYGLDVKKSKTTPVCDIRDLRAVLKNFEKIAKAESKIDILINNAGVAIFNSFEQRTYKELNKVFDSNIVGALNCIKAFVKHSNNNNTQKSIVNIGSIYGKYSPDFRVYTDCKRTSSEIYGITKAGIIHLTKYFAVKLASKNIRVNCVSPGGILNIKNPQGSDFIKRYSYRVPQNRMANVEEITGAVLYFSSDLASYTNGQNIFVDGGLTCW